MYEKEGLIVPFRKEKNHRLYSDLDIERLNCIRSAINESKISIAGIKTMYALIPCWEIIHCSDQDRANCAAYDKSAHSQPCWTFVHKDNVCESNECRKCKVYNDYAVCQKIKETIIDLTKRKNGDN